MTVANIEKITTNIFSPSAVIENLIKEESWNITYKTSREAKEGRYVDISSLEITNLNKKYLNSKYPGGIYEHQKACIDLSAQGFDVCLSTSTASGKTLAFQVSAIEVLAKNPKAKVLAVYPLKALTTEQEIKWKQAVKEAGLDINVGRIDGSINTDISIRTSIIENSGVIIMTPDVIQSWLFTPSVLEKKTVYNFLKNLSLVIADEVHVYTGVFGSKSLFLFRTLEHLCSILDNRYKYITASATMKNSGKHLKNLFGRCFKIIDNTKDSSPKQKVNFYFIEAPKGEELNTAFSQFIKKLSQKDIFNTIAFVDSRKQAEQTAANSDKNGNTVMPYRSGLEEKHRLEIQQSLSSGKLKAVISTSALEMGIDIPCLNTAILFGVPGSKTSLYQRIGRIGRHGEGNVIIINDGSFASASVFRDPESLFNLPLTESALYMDNKIIQYQSALILAGKDSAHDIISKKAKKYNSVFTTGVKFPQSFIDLCNNERIGDIDRDCANIKANFNNEPNKNIPLRHCEEQYKIEIKSGVIADNNNKGSVTRSQMMREAYPGAVYYYLKNTYKVVRINNSAKTIEVRETYGVTTKPKFTPTFLSPMFNSGKIFTMQKRGQLIMLECDMNVEQSVIGYTEFRGNSQESFNYPIEGIYSGRSFKNFYSTTGVILKHPVMNDPNVNLDLLSQLIFEAFLLTIPFERHDIEYGFDKFKTDKGEISKGDKFISIYDGTSGSLRLTSRLINDEIISNVIEKACEIAINDSDKFEHNINGATINAIREIFISLNAEKYDLHMENEVIKQKSDKTIVIAEGSSGVVLGKNIEFFVKKVYFRPEGLYYKGFYEDNEKIIVSLPVDNVRIVEGKSVTGYFDFEEGEVIEVQDLVSL